MAEHRPTDTLLALLQQALESAPQGLAPRHLLDRLVELGEDISRPTLNRLLVQGVDQGLWAPHGSGRSIVYMLGQPIPPLSSTDTPMTDVQNTPDTSLTNAQQPQKRGKAAKVKKEVKPISLHDRIRNVVWWVADTLRDKTGLQVEAYQPVTLVMLALKRNLDIQLEQLQAGGKTAEILATELPMLKAGLRDVKDVARTLNGANGFWDATELQGERFGLPLMTWTDLANFKDSNTSGPREVPLVMVLNANPEGHRTADTALFTYTTKAPDLKALILEIVKSMVPDLREAFAAIGLHGVMGTGSEHAATLSNQTLRYICTEPGTSGAARLVDFDLGLKNISVDVFSDTYMDLLGRFAEDSGKRGGEYFTPTSMVDNLLKFIPMKRFVQRIHNDQTWVMRIADPTAGSNTFLIKAHEHLEQAARNMGLPTPPHRQLAFFAQELKNTQVGLGVFNMFYHGLAPRLNPTEEEIYVGRRPEESGIVARTTGNTITEYVDKIGKQADKIELALANPPYGTADYGLTHALSARGHVKDGRWISGVPTRSEGEWPFVQTIVNLLSPTGMAGIVLPMGLLFRDGGSDYRQWLIENDWLEGVIAAPSNQFLTTSIPVCLLIINKNKDPEHRGGVFFVNATEDFTKQGKFNHWNVERALQAWEERREEAGYSGFVSTERFRKAPKSTLAVSRWFSPIREKEELNPGEMSQMANAIQTMLGLRGQWLGGVMDQAEGRGKQSHSGNGSAGEGV